MTKSIPASISQFLRWLADRSALVSAQAARKVWQQFGIEDRMGYFLAVIPIACFPKVNTQKWKLSSTSSC